MFLLYTDNTISCHKTSGHEKLSIKLNENGEIYDTFVFNDFCNSENENLRDLKMKFSL